MWVMPFHVFLQPSEHRMDWCDIYDAKPVLTCAAGLACFIFFWNSLIAVITFTCGP